MHQKTQIVHNLNSQSRGASLNSVKDATYRDLPTTRRYLVNNFASGWRGDTYNILGDHIVGDRLTTIRRYHASEIGQPKYWLSERRPVFDTHADESSPIAIFLDEVGEQKIYKYTSCPTESEAIPTSICTTQPYIASILHDCLADAAITNGQSIRPIVDLLASRHGPTELHDRKLNFLRSQIDAECIDPNYTGRTSIFLAARQPNGMFSQTFCKNSQRREAFFLWEKFVIEHLSDSTETLEEFSRNLSRRLPHGSQVSKRDLENELTDRLSEAGQELDSAIPILILKIGSRPLSGKEKGYFQTSMGRDPIKNKIYAAHPSLDDTLGPLNLLIENGKVAAQRVYLRST